MNRNDLSTWLQQKFPGKMHIITMPTYTQHVPTHPEDAFLWFDTIIQEIPESRVNPPETRSMKLGHCSAWIVADRFMTYFMISDAWGSEKCDLCDQPGELIRPEGPRYCKSCEARIHAQIGKK